MLAKIFKILPTVVIALMVIPEANCQAQPYKVCLEKTLLKIEPGEKIKILDHDGNSISGRLVAINLDKSIVTMSQTVTRHGRFACQSLTVNGRDISEIKFLKTGKFDAKYIGIGFGAGGFVGMIVGGHIGQSKSSGAIADFSGLEGMVWGAGIGAGVGLLLGTILPPLIPAKYETIKCKS
ncbi:MAG: hypothetical protein AMJ92_02390 [candidate division Zixibacteria bacterium SM23_81]|nr:MAG: hypothetical protein AMJ92_02390 [candidate division Zixibacteria bacterium SM23_81]